LFVVLPVWFCYVSRLLELYTKDAKYWPSLHNIGSSLYGLNYFILKATHMSITMPILQKGTEGLCGLLEITTGKGFQCLNLKTSSPWFQVPSQYSLCCVPAQLIVWNITWVPLR
jgi:hypothetical protein